MNQGKPYPEVPFVNRTILGRLLVAFLLLGVSVPLAAAQRAPAASDDALRAEILKERQHHEDFLVKITHQIVRLVEETSAAIAPLPWVSRAQTNSRPLEAGRTLRQQLLYERAQRTRDRQAAARVLSHLEQIKANMRPAHYDQWMCIHNGEGAWDSDTGNGYYGGLQMDKGFMDTYGSDMKAKYGGPANLWSPTDQMIVANRAYATRGFSPWPNTARACGLL
jgi:transglycosylase-like protein